MRKISQQYIVEILYIIVSAVYLYFQHFRFAFLLGNINVLFLVSSVLLLGGFLIFNYKCIRLYGEDYGLAVYCFYMVLDGLFRTRYFNEALEYWAILLAVFAFKIILGQHRSLIGRYMEMLFKCSVLATSAIVLQYFFPNIVSAIQKICFTPSAYQEAVRIYNLGYCTGITPLAAVAVWFCAIMISFGFAELLCRRSNLVRSASICIWSLLAMFLTQKRSILLAVLIAGYLFFFLFSKNRGLRLIKIAGITLALLLAILLAYYTLPQMKYMIDKTFFSDRALSGRETLWETMLTMFENNPVWGSGGGICKYTFGFGGHNCYLQLLAEYGCVGLILFIIVFVIPFFYNLYRAAIFVRIKQATDSTVWLLAALFLQAVFYIYCVSGNPLFDNIFIITHMACMGISSSILREIRPFRFKWR